MPCSSDISLLDLEMNFPTIPTPTPTGDSSEGKGVRRHPGDLSCRSVQRGQDHLRRNDHSLERTRTLCQEDQAASEPWNEAGMSYEVKPNHAAVYTPLKPWQSRVLRLYPAEALVEDQPWNEDDLQADLLVVNLSIVEGVTIEGTERIIDYTAISYAWTGEDESDSMLCNGASISITPAVSLLLRTLRHSTNATYLWIDTLCINQSDQEEKSVQVARMLKIYEKAKSVIAWLGNPDADSRLAFESIRDIPALEDSLVTFSAADHDTLRCERLTAVYIALIDLYRRPWLSRTWIRQEVYGARRLIVQCGDQQASWADFINGAYFMKKLRLQLIDKEPEVPLPFRYESNVFPLIEEAMANASMPISGMKPPRDLIEVLLNSRNYGITELKDTFYAVLGMCNVPTVTNHMKKGEYQPRNAVLVDYLKPLTEIYEDATLYALGRQGESESLAQLWHSYKRSPLHDEGLPSWAVDWRSGVLAESHRKMLQYHMRSWEYGTKGGHLNHHDGEAPWIPLWHSNRRIHENYTTLTMNTAKPWHWPEPLETDRSVLCIKARVLNYVAYLSEYTCDVGDFLIGSSDTFLSSSDEFRLGSAGLSVHARDEPRKNSYLFSRLPKHKLLFDRKHDNWRIAILGVANDAQICLVPATARLGDLVVAIAPKTLPMLIRPRESDGTAGGLFRTDDPYRRVPGGGIPYLASYEKTGFRFTIISVLLIIFSICFFDLAISFAPSWINTTSLISLAACFAVIFVIRAWITAGRIEDWNARYDGYEDNISPAIGHFIWVPMFFMIGVFMLVGDPPLKDSPHGMVFCIYNAAAVVVIHFNKPWKYFKRLEHFVEVALRRQVVLDHLDHATETIGEDYEFVGPMFVRCHKRYRMLWNWDVWPHKIALGMMILVKKLSHAARRRETSSALNFSQIHWLAREIFAQPIDIHSPPAWDRPLQELRLH